MSIRQRFEKAAIEAWGWDRRRLERNSADEYIDEGIADAWMAFERLIDAYQESADCFRELPIDPATPPFIQKYEEDRRRASAIEELDDCGMIK